MPPSRELDAGSSPLALFGAELRHYRTTAGLSQEQLGERIGYSTAQVGAVETARRLPTEDFAIRCDAVLELATGGALARLRDHLRDQLHRQVWPTWFREWPSIEREAVSLCSWELAIVPGLLQTSDYARAILHGVLTEATDEDVDDKVSARLQRQEILNRQDPPMLWSVMDEAALRRRIGDAAIMRAQIDHLIEMAKRPKVKILIVPASTGAHRGLTGAFEIAEFRDAPDMAWLETSPQGQITDHPQILKACVQVFDTLRAEALPPRASFELIIEVRDSWT